VVDRSKPAMLTFPSMSDTKIIDYIGTTGEVAALCGVHKSTVSQWRKRGIPEGWRRWLKQIKPRAFRSGK